MADVEPIGAEHSSRMAELQGAGHGDQHDYVVGSPHLRHAALFDRVDSAITEAIGVIISRKGTCDVLEVGAGHGTFTESALVAGARVTVTEMSRPSVEYLQSKFAKKPSVTIVYDKDGEEAFRRQSKYDVVLFISVLHHIPDYLGLIGRMTEELVRPGGAIITYQDPLWYPRQSRAARVASWASYFAWRITQGELKHGLATRWRRLRGQLDENNISDMVEYHVVRNGVDDQSLRRLLSDNYDAVEIDAYWSTQSQALQNLGTGRFPPNTFGIVASDRKDL
jgi:2-polyprenyl-3-methyl-5-hydroxy-6-metoxy-1,4-benzoquinol methylase